MGLFWVLDIYEHMFIGSMEACKNALDGIFVLIIGFIRVFDSMESYCPFSGLIFHPEPDVVSFIEFS